MKSRKLKSPAFAGLFVARALPCSSGRTLFFGAVAWPCGMTDEKLVSFDQKTHMADEANRD